jgi:hypothetical protein
MSGPAYPAAHAIAAKVRDHFARHVADAQQRGQKGLAAPPDADTIEALIDAAFWASLRREENVVPTISLAFLTPDEAPSPLRFDRAIPLEPGRLVKLAPAVERAGIHLGVHRDGGALWVWGTVRMIPPLCVVVEVTAPGLLVVKHHRGGEAGKFVNVAVLEGDRVKMVDERASSLPDCPPLLTSLLGFDSPASWIDSVNVLVQLAVSMRAHRRGGILLIVPDSSDAWMESIVNPIPYAVSPPFDVLGRLARASSAGESGRTWQDALTRVVDLIAGLTAVDGATIMTTRYDVLAFGAKIARKKGSPQIEQVVVTEPIEGGVAGVMHPTQLGGTRHLSAAQFVHDQRDAVVLVASQDGRFTVFAWSPCENMVHAHRVEVLLL